MSFRIGGAEFECSFLDAVSIGRIDDPSAPMGPRIRASIRRVGAEEWINIPSSFGSREEAMLAVKEYLEENYPTDEPD